MPFLPAERVPSTDFVMPVAEFHVAKGELILDALNTLVVFGSESCCDLIQ